MRLVAILCWVSMIVVKTWLERDSKFSVHYPSVGVVSGVLVDLIFFWILSIYPFVVAMEGGICFISPIVRSVHVEKWLFLMARIKVLQTGLNSVAWYHCSSSVLVLSNRALSASGCFSLGRWYGFLVRLT